MAWYPCNLNSNLGDLSPVLLWTNPSPTSAFAEQTVSLDLSEYEGVIVEGLQSTSTQNLLYRVYVKKGDTTISSGSQGFGFGFNSNSSSNATSRGVSIVANGVKFTSCKEGNTVENAYQIPYRIYGVKKYVVAKNQLSDYDKYKFYADNLNVANSNSKVFIANSDLFSDVSNSVVTVKKACSITFHMQYYSDGTDSIYMTKNGVRTTYSGSRDGHNITISFNAGDTFFFSSGAAGSNGLSKAIAYVE